MAGGRRRRRADHGKGANRRRDVDGMLSACKSAIDGIADVLGVDDSKWVFNLRRSAPKAPGTVRIEIEVVG